MVSSTEAERSWQDSLLLTRNLLRIAIYNISYIRGLFHETYFGDNSIPGLEMKIKKLMPMDAESRRMIDWMEKAETCAELIRKPLFNDYCIYHALQKKYLKTLLFCISEEKGPLIEEYVFCFSYPNTANEEFAMDMSRTGSEKCSTTFSHNASEVTPDQMRRSACKMIRTLVSLMRTLDPMPEERTILMKLLYYDDVTPEDYEPPFFKCCADNEATNIWNKNPLKMELGTVNSKHLVLALKAKSVLDSSGDNSINSGDDVMSVENETYQDDDFSDTEAIDTNAEHVQSERNELLKVPEIRDGSTMGCLHSIRSDLTRTGELPTLQHNVSMQSGQETLTLDKDPSRNPTSARQLAVPVCYLESGLQGQKNKRSLTDGTEMQSTQNKRSRKARMESDCVTGFLLCTNMLPIIRYWNLDSGATNHITGQQSWIKNERRIPDDKKGIFVNAAKKQVKLETMGDILSTRLRLYNVYLSNDIGVKELYISIGQLTNDGYRINIVSGQVTIHLPDNMNHIVGRGSLDSEYKAYVISFFNDSVLDRSKKQATVAESDDSYKVAKGTWMLDTGAPCHLTRKKRLLAEEWTLRKPKKFAFAGKGEIKCTKKGNVSLPKLQLNNVYYSAQFGSNIISARKLNNIGYNFFFSEDQCYITFQKEKRLSGLAHKDAGNNIYYVEFLYSKN